MLRGNPRLARILFGVTTMYRKFWAHALGAIVIGLLPVAVVITGTAAWAAYRIILPEFTQPGGE